VRPRTSSTGASGTSALATGPPDRP
jgi:hypothetical protein